MNRQNSQKRKEIKKKVPFLTFAVYVNVCVNVYVCDGTEQKRQKENVR